MWTVDWQLWKSGRQREALPAIQPRREYILPEWATRKPWPSSSSFATRISNCSLQVQLLFRGRLLDSFPSCSPSR